MAVVVTDGCRYTAYNAGPTEISSITSSMATLQPVAVDMLWSSSAATATSTSHAVADSNDTASLGFQMAGTQVTSTQSLGFPYSILVPSTTTTAASGGGDGSESNHDRASPAFQTLNRFAFDSGIIEDVRSPSGDAKSKSGHKSHPQVAPQEVAGGAVSGSLKPPKKSLTPYMRFSKSVWQQVKQANPNTSVCELGTIIGKLWRQLGDADKKSYFDDFNRGKDEYNDELRVYLDATGLKSSDLNKPRARKDGNTPKKSHSSTSQVEHTMTTTMTPSANSLPPVLTQGNGQRWPPTVATLDNHVNSSWPVASAISATQQPFGTGSQTVMMLSNAFPQQSQTTSTAYGGSTAKPAVVQSGAGGMLVFHVRQDGTRECYIDRGHMDRGGNSIESVAPSQREPQDSKMQERCQLLGVLNEKVSVINMLKSQLSAAHARISELQQQNELLRQIRDATVAPAAAR